MHKYRSHCEGLLHFINSMKLIKKFPAYKNHFIKLLNKEVFVHKNKIEF